MTEKRSHSFPFRFAALPALAALFAVVLAGCRSGYGINEQNQLASLYYSGKLEECAKYASSISDAEKDRTDGEAVLWHLESGSANFDAGRYKESMTSLERAEKLLYLVDSYDTLNVHRPGLSGSYQGYLSDRLLLHLLKGMNYLQQGKVEDFLVEMRRMRVSQFRYYRNGIDPDIKLYDAENRGKRVPPLKMKRLREDGETRIMYQNSGTAGDFEEFNRGKRPELSIMANPLGFYFSALAYRWENEPDEAMIDLRLLRKMDPENPLVRRELHTVETELDEDLTDPEEKSVPFSLSDQTVCVVLGEGEPDGWKNLKRSVNLSGQVPASWTICAPDYRKFDSSGLMTAEAGGKTYQAGVLADLSDIMREDYYQNRLPENTRSALSTIKATTVANKAAKAQLVAAAAISDPYAREIAIAVAAAAVEATSRAYIDQSEWRRWRTVPRRYQLLNLPIAGDRRFSVSVPGNGGGAGEKFEFTLGPDTNRAMIYIRKIGGTCHVKKFESLE